MSPINFRSKRHAKEFADYLKHTKGHKCKIKKHPTKNFHNVVITKKGKRGARGKKHNITKIRGY